MNSRLFLFLCLFLIKFVISKENVTEQLVSKVNNSESTSSPSHLRLARNALPNPLPRYHDRYDNTYTVSAGDGSDTLLIIVIIVIVILVLGCLGGIGGCIYCCIYGCCCSPKEQDATRASAPAQTWAPPPAPYAPVAPVAVPVGPPGAPPMVPAAAPAAPPGALPAAPVQPASGTPATSPRQQLGQGAAYPRQPTA